MSEEHKINKKVQLQKKIKSNKAGTGKLNKNSKVDYINNCFNNNKENIYYNNSLINDQNNENFKLKIKEENSETADTHSKI